MPAITCLAGREHPAGPRSWSASPRCGPARFRATARARSCLRLPRGS